MVDLPRSAPPRPVEVALVDDHRLVGLGLRAALSHHRAVRFVAAHETVRDLLDADVAPALVLLDLRLADGSSPADNVRRLRDAGMQVLVFTSAEEPYLLREALRADVLGVLRKSEPIDEVVRAVLIVAAGRPIVTPEWAHAVAHDPLLRDAGLSTQEERVLSRFADGQRSGEVAEALHITIGTLEDYVRRIRAKYEKAGRGAPTKIDLYKRAVEDGLLPAPRRA